MILKELWKDPNQIKTAWIRKGIIILTFPFVLFFTLITSIAMILSAEFGSLYEMWDAFKNITIKTWKGPIKKSPISE